MDVDEIINRLKSKYDAKTDQELARALFLGSSAIGSWRSRGSVPERYLKHLEGNMAVTFAFDFNDMGKDESLALSLAIMRLMRDESRVISDPREFLAKGSHLGALLVRKYYRAIEDIQPKAEESLSEGWESRFNVLAYDEFFAES